MRRAAYVDRAQAGKRTGKIDSEWQAVEAPRPNVVCGDSKASGRAAARAPQERLDSQLRLMGDPLTPKYLGPASRKRPGSQLHAESESSLFETLAQRLIERAQAGLRLALPAVRRADGRLSNHLDAPWAMALAGPTAPTDLLRRLAGTGQLRPSPAAPARNGDQSDWPSPLAGDRKSREVEAQAGRAASRPGASRELIHSRREQGESPPAASDEVGQREADGHRAVGRAPEQIAPPSLAESLPPLTPQQAETTRVLPLASETARRGARDESVAPEDLDALAAKIKLILDEQARRHGIDV
jgi:hypothetical protein